MTDMEMTTEAEVEDFTDELSDEALDRAEGGVCSCATLHLQMVPVTCADGVWCAPLTLTLLRFWAVTCAVADR